MLVGLIKANSGYPLHEDSSDYDYDYDYDYDRRRRRKKMRCAQPCRHSAILI
jgi:hypothetical protein